MSDISDFRNKIITGDAEKSLKLLPDNSVHCIVTSPPYFRLRDYGVSGQIGMEKSPEEFVSKLVSAFREAKRVLRDDGTCWIIIGDSYAGYYGSKYGKPQSFGKGRPKNIGQAPPTKESFDFKTSSFKNKDLLGIPWRLALALQADGWYLRCDIIWNKENPMPESVKSRPSRSHEYIFMLSKSPKYYYDYKSIRQPAAASSIKRMKQDIENQKGSTRSPLKTNGNMKAVGCWDGLVGKRSVWTVNTQPNKLDHFAIYPPELIVDCIKSGCPEGGYVLDMFFGTGTTGKTALRLNRNFVAIELNPKTVRIAERELKPFLNELFV